MKSINVVVTSAGGIVAQGIIKSLKFHNKYSKVRSYEYKILATDISYEAAGLYRAHKFSLIPKPTSKEYLKSVVDLCNRNKIKVLFIGSDVELPILCNNKEYIENKTGTVIITSQPNIVEMCRDKYKTYEFLKENNSNSIPTCLSNEIDDFLKDHKFPLVVKPREGFGSKLFQIVNSIEELEFATKAITQIGWKPMIQKYLQGDSNEYTTGLTLGRDKNQIMSNITLKKILKHGQTYKAFIDKYPKVSKVCIQIAKKLKTFGPLNIQSRIDMDDNQVKIIEINPRFSASGPMRTMAGVNEPDIMVRNVLFNEVVKPQEHKSLVCFRYWNETYIDKEKYERTMIQKGSVKTLNSSIVDYF
ncbi:ATP-grasp domain-containing protein [soil metagenome]